MQQRPYEDKERLDFLGTISDLGVHYDIVLCNKLAPKSDNKSNIFFRSRLQNTKR